MHRGRRSAAASRDIKRATASFQHLVVQREDRRRRARGDVPGTVDGNLRRRPAVHRLSRHEPAPDGCAREDERRVGRLQVRRGPEGILDRPDAARDVARHRRPAAAVRVRRRRPTRRSCRSRRRIGCWSRKAKARSLATFTPPHTFFFTREVDTNLGYVWYRKDAATTFGFGIRQADARGESRSTSRTSRCSTRRPARCSAWACTSTRARTPAKRRARRCCAFTHGDTFKPVPGYKTFVNHFHLRFTDRVRASGSFDTPMQDLAAMKALGLNIVGLSDFHGDLHAERSGAAAVQGSEGLLRGDAPRVGRRFPGHAVGGAERVLRRALQHHVPEAERLLVQGAPAGAAVHARSIRSTARSITPAARTTCSR